MVLDEVAEEVVGAGRRPVDGVPAEPRGALGRAHRPPPMSAFIAVTVVRRSRCC